MQMIVEVLTIRDVVGRCMLVEGGGGLEQGTGVGFPSGFPVAVQMRMG